MSKIVVAALEGPSTTSNKITIASGSQLDIAGSPDGSSAINLAVDAGDITTGTLADARFASDSILFVKETVIAADSTVSSDPNGSWVEATGCNITIAAADVNRCSKLIVCITASFRCNEATHTFGKARVTRTAPSTADGGSVHFGDASNDAAGETYDVIDSIYVDESLSSADHIYKLYYSDGTSTYSSTMYPLQGQCVITVIGVK
jgi:hypothetical protein